MFLPILYFGSFIGVLSIFVERVLAIESEDNRFEELVDDNSMNSFGEVYSSI
jgi:hypothetical protein